MRVVICDDDEVRGRDDWAARIEMAIGTTLDVEVQVLGTYELAAAIESLEQRSVAARANEPGRIAYDDAASVIDAADILVIDYDLTPDSNTLAESDVEREKVIWVELRAQTAETVAYLSRCYSRCGSIVIVNHDFKVRTFDTTFLKFVDSWADFNISQDELGQTELWRGEGSGFKPWSWLTPFDARDLFHRRIEQVDLDAGVLSSLGFLPIEDSGLDSRQLDALGDEPDIITFRTVARAPDLGLAGRDIPIDDGALRRIAAAGIGRWLDRVVMTAQNVLVDAPHLFYRLPSMLPGGATEEKSWNEALQFNVSQLEAANVALVGKQVEACKWFSRPTWFWPKLRSDETIPEVATPWSSRSYRWTFAEDVSRFIDISVAAEVDTDLPGPYSRRFVARLDDVQYRPRQRILR
jgi:hypothetical protein